MANKELPINPFTGNPILSFNTLDKNINSITNELKQGNLVIFQYPQGDCLFLNNTGINETYKMIQYDPKRDKAIRAELPIEAVNGLFNNVLNSKDPELQGYSLFMIKKTKEDLDLIEDFVQITNGLLNLIKPNKDYFIRKLD